jgi:excisionase family DNA binding protein
MENLQKNVNELITLRTEGMTDAMQSMKDIESLFDKVTSNYRPLLDGERYLSDVEVSHRLKISRRTLQEYRDNGMIPYFKLGGKVLYRESDLERVLQECYHPAYRVA